MWSQRMGAGALGRKAGKGFSEMTSMMKRWTIGRVFYVSRQQWHIWRGWEKASGLDYSGLQSGVWI